MQAQSLLEKKTCPKEASCLTLTCPEFGPMDSHGLPPCRETAITKTARATHSSNSLWHKKYSGSPFLGTKFDANRRKQLFLHLTEAQHPERELRKLPGLAAEKEKDSCRNSTAESGQRPQPLRDLLTTTVADKRNKIPGSL